MHMECKLYISKNIKILFYKQKQPNIIMVVHIHIIRNQLFYYLSLSELMVCFA